MTYLDRVCAHRRAGLLAARAALLATACLSSAALAQATSETPQTGDPAEQNGEEIVVVGARASREAAVERKREAPTIRDVVASDGIGKLPDYNTAEAVQRLPGISVEIDQGEPRYVVIRGVDPNLNQVTIDGNLVGAPEAEGRRVSLDTIPSDLVAAIEVVKAVTPDYDANAVGGSINIITPTAFDKAGDILNFRAQGSFNEKADRLGYGAAGTYGTRFGPDETFGIVVGGSYFRRYLDSDLAEFDWGTVGGIAAPVVYRLYDYHIMRERIGGIVNLDWRPNDDTRLYLRNIYNEFTDHEERDQLEQELGTGTPISNTEISYTRGRAYREFRQNNQTQKLFNISPGAELRFGPAQLDLNYTYAHAEEHTPIRDDIEFRTGTIFDTTLDISGERPAFTSVDPDAYNAANFPLRRIRERREQIDEDLHAIRADLRYDFEGATPGFIKVGGKYTNRKKIRDNRQSQKDPVAPVPTFASIPGAVLPEPEDYYDGDYQFGPAMNYGAIIDYLYGNPTLFRLNEATTQRNELSLDYDIHEKITAGYAMGQVELGDLTAIGGVRVEHTDGRYKAYAIPSFEQLTFDNTYTDVLPSIHLNYKAAPDVLLRAAWTNTIGRPNYDAVVPTFTEDSGAGTAGNPDLQPYKAIGFDISAEYYPDSESILSLGIFYRGIENPIYTSTILDTEFAGVELTSLSQPRNAGKGDIFGIEGNFQRRFSFLPAPFDGLGVSVNGTYTASGVDVPGRERDDLPFFRQSDWIVNAALFYENGPFEARLALNYRDDYLASVGANRDGDIYAASRTVLDARASYRFGGGFEIFGSISNFTEAPNAAYQGIASRLSAREDYGFNADFGLSFSF